MRRIAARGELAFHDIDDIDGFVGLILNDQLSKNGAFLERERWEDAHSFLLETVLREMHKWDKTKYPKFSNYVRIMVSRRFVDWYRKELGDSRYKTKRPELVSYEAMNEHQDAKNNTPTWATGNTPSGYGRTELSTPDFAEDCDTRVSLQVAFSELSEKGKWTLEHIAYPVSEKVRFTEIAETHGKSTKWVREQLDALRVELEAVGVNGWV